MSDLVTIGSRAATTAFCAEKVHGPGGFLWIDGNGKITGSRGTFANPVPNAFSLVQVDDCPGSTPTCRASCLSSHHKVLTADLRYVPLKSVAVGDALLSFDENASQHGAKSTRKHRPGAVRAIKHEVAETFTVSLASGKHFITTADHLWLIRNKTRTPGKRHSGGYIWRRTDQLKEGFDEATRVLDEWEPAISFEAGWLSGLYDGEGCLSRASSSRTAVAANLVLSQKAGPVLERAKQACASVLHSETYSYRAQKRDVWQLRLNGGRRAIAKTLGVLRPTRLLGKFTPDMLGSLEGAEFDMIVSVRAAGRNEITRIDVDAGTMIVEGYAHHNCYVHNLEKAAKSTHDMYRHNSTEIRRILGLSRRGRAVWAQAFADTISQLPEFRWHVSGDVFSGAYAEWLTDVAWLAWDTRQWIYTRTFDRDVLALLYEVSTINGGPLAVNLSFDRDNYWAAPGAVASVMYGGSRQQAAPFRIAYMASPGESVPTCLPRGSIVFPDYELRERDATGPADARARSAWYQALTAEQRRGLCPIDFYGGSEARRCGPTSCDRCLR